MNLTQTGIVTAQLKAIPAPKHRRKWLKTLLGTVLLLGALGMPKYLGFPWQAALGVAGFGGWLVSQDVVVGYLKVVPAFIRDVVTALKGQA